MAHQLLINGSLTAARLRLSSGDNFGMERRSRAGAAVGSAVFFVVAPGVVAGLIPWWLSGYRMGSGPGWLLAMRIGIGGLLLGAGLVVLVRAFVRFVREGWGTPAPVAPPEVLVVGGDYRYVRNPMYVAVVGCVLGQALILGSLALLGYAVVVWLGMAAFVRWYEEPTLRSQFGADYEEYRGAVPAWIPRIRPWRPAA
jgi:protein-S-isoprenylcysteine O-methyltransferase Ste14